jgi:hypothetical protein
VINSRRTHTSDVWLEQESGLTAEQTRLLNEMMTGLTAEQRRLLQEMLVEEQTRLQPGLTADQIAPGHTVG